MKDQLFNRKVLFSLLAVVMCLGFTAMSDGAAVVSVDPAEIESPAAGEELMVSINIMGGEGVAGYEADVSFDPTALEYVSHANGDYLPAGAIAVPTQPTENSIKVSAVAIGATADGDGTLATVTFKVVEAKASMIGLSGVIIADAASVPLEITTADGMVTVPAAEEEAAAEEPDAEEEAAAEEPDAEEEAAAEEPDAEEEAAAEEPDAEEEAAAEEPDAEEEAAAEEPDAEEEAAAEEPDAEEEAAAEEPDAEKEPVSQMFEITLTNLTTGEAGSGGQIFSPPIFVTHAAGINLAEVGQPASPALVALAENGDTSGLVLLAAAAGANSRVADGVVPPGGSVTVTVTADMVNASLSVGSMLVSTNDAFIAATDVPLFDEEGMPVSVSIDLMSYDAGSEHNTEMASDIPGPLGLDAEADPEGSNGRVSTEGGVIAAHEGIQGIGDVGEAFAWEEPTAMLMITPVEAPAEPVVETPAEPVVEEPMMTEAPGFNVTLTPGLNMISVPLMPEKPHTAKSLAEMLGATVVIQLDTATQNFVGYTTVDQGDGFGIEGGMGYIVNTPTGTMVKFTGRAWNNQPEREEPTAEEEAPAEEPAAEEPVAEEPAAAPALSTDKSAWAFIVTSDIHGMLTETNYTLVAENLRTGTIATENFTGTVKRSSAVWADLNRKSVVEAGDKLKVALYDEHSHIVSGPLERTVSTADIRNAFLNLQLNVGDVRPEDTILAQNYPNPFNPETWIPYQLRQSTEVTISIYNIAGHLVRTLDLGLKPTGSYMTPATAAYWDGKNSVGERVASGIYFYTLQTADFAATRRMVILK